jgi:radical SAM superfamily enzyme YgiQ (UPF0313 family)
VNVLLVSTYELGRQPFGVASAAAWLRDAGATVSCLDLAVEKPANDGVLASAELVAFYIPMHTATRLAIPVAQRVHRINPQAHLCFFGLYAAMNERLLSNLGDAAILSGEFESGLVSLLRHIQGTKTGHTPSISLDRQHFLKPDRSGLPALAKYAKLCFGKEQRLVGYTEASRGCKHLCRHCPIVPIYGGRFRVVAEDVVLADIEQQVRAGARHITFGDPDFWNGPTHSGRIIQELHRRFPVVTYDVTIKVEHLLRNRSGVPLLKDTGCLFVTTAVESVDDEVLALLDKGHTRADFIRVVELFREIDLTLVPTFVAFTPWTTIESYIELLHLLSELDLVENVSPIQLAVRLLVPAGSRLLELPSVQRLMQPFDPIALCHRWAHPDARVDQLQTEVLARVRYAATRDASRRTVFSETWALAHNAAGRIAPPYIAEIGRPRFIPYLTEPWYC